MSDQKQFVFNGMVVVMTGRQAKKDDSAILGRRSRVSLVEFLHEITPLDKEEGSWKKWVRMNELYTIVEDNNE